MPTGTYRRLSPIYRNIQQGNVHSDLWTVVSIISLYSSRKCPLVPTGGCLQYTVMFSKEMSTRTFWQLSPIYHNIHMGNVRWCRGHTTLTPICARACVFVRQEARPFSKPWHTIKPQSTMSTNIQNSFNFSSCMHKKPLILVKWIQITYVISFNSHYSLQYSKVLL